jgi:hypothetical protein
MTQAIGIKMLVIQRGGAVIFRELSGFCGNYHGLAPILCHGRGLCVDGFATDGFPTISTPREGWNPVSRM